VNARAPDASPPDPPQRVALIGFGEAGSILGADLVLAGCDVSMYDILLDDTTSRAAMLARAQRAHVRSTDSFAAAVAGAELIISAVTAASSGEVAALAGRHLGAGQVFLDINSVSPAKKQSSCRAVEASGADYVESAVMAPLPPYRLKVPMLLGGKHAAAVADQLTRLGMNARAIASDIGVASAVKMCRSIIIKGIESLAVESMLAARHFGAEDPVLASLSQTFPGMGWDKELPDYLVSRVAEHGRRRAAEMREVARTLQDAGFEPTMANAIADRQDDLIDVMTSRGLSYSNDEPFSWRRLADALASHATHTSGAGGSDNSTTAGAGTPDERR
jgi:3-hydroxyisobutyrate dehydrogenase-like beta-hydroxyacid dehydrogenase